MTEGEDSEKSHEPTARKLEKAREKGQVVRSQDIMVSASYAGLLLAFLAVGDSPFEALVAALKGFVVGANDLSQQVFEGHPSSALGGLAQTIGISVAPWFALPAVAVMMSIWAQKSFVATPDKLKLKLSRINPVQNARQKYGPRGLFEFIKSFVKLAAFALCLGFFLNARLGEIVGVGANSENQIVVVLARLCMEFLIYAFIISMVIAGIDYLWQRHEFLSQNRMSQKELKDEMKEAEGDPYIKGTRRQKAQQIASSQMMAAIPESDVVIVNPTHFAVVLKWDRAREGAPVCVAKGRDELARKIKDIAKENNIPIHRDPPTARALFASISINEEVHQEHYKAVAAAIRFADSMREKARGWC